MFILFIQAKVGDKLTYYEQEYTVVDIRGADVIARRTQDGRDVRIKYTELATNGNIKITHTTCVRRPHSEAGEASILSRLGDKQREIVSKKLALIKPILLYERIKGGDKRAVQQFYSQFRTYLDIGVSIDSLTQEQLIKQIIATHGSSRASIMRYLSKYYRHGLEGLIPSSGRGHTGRKDTTSIEICYQGDPDIVVGVIQTRVPEVYHPLIKEVIETEYLNKQRKIISQAYRAFRRKCRDCMPTPLKPLEYITFYKMFKHLDPKLVERARHAANAANKYDDVIRGFSNEEALYPLDIVQIDHTQLDIDVVDDTRLNEIGRPWITLGIDVYSRMIWCMYISFEEPSANVVSKAIQNGVFPPDVQQDYGTSFDWLAYGIPNIIYVDNGMDFRSTGIERLVHDVLQSEIMHRPIKTPNYGGVIERYFGTLNSEVIHALPGTRKNSVVAKGEYDSVGEAALTLTELTQLLMIFMTDVYPVRRHHGLPPDENSPRVRYLRGLDIGGQPRLLAQEDREKYYLEFLPQEKRQYRRDGVQLSNVLYKAEGRPDLISDDRKKQRYTIKYDPDDISVIYLKDPKTHDYIKLFAVQPSYERLVGMNQYTYNKLLQLSRARGETRRQGIATDDEILDAEVRMERIVNEGYKNTRTTRRQAKRMNAEVIVSLPSTKTHPAIANPRERELLAAAKEAEAKRRRSRYE